MRMRWPACGNFEITSAFAIVKGLKCMQPVPAALVSPELESFIRAKAHQVMAPVFQGV